jgi:hypothetical protein
MGTLRATSTGVSIPPAKAIIAQSSYVFTIAAAIEL